MCVLDSKIVPARLLWIVLQQAFKFTSLHGLNKAAETLAIDNKVHVRNNFEGVLNFPDEVRTCIHNYTVSTEVIRTPSL